MIVTGFRLCFALSGLFAPQFAADVAVVVVSIDDFLCHDDHGVDKEHLVGGRYTPEFHGSVVEVYFLTHCEIYVTQLFENR